MSNEDIAKGIIARTYEDTTGLVLTDSLPFQARGYKKNGREFRIADEFAENGVILTRANTQRIYGWKQVRDRLIGRDGIPLLYFQKQCQALRDYVPMLGRHKSNPEDAEESGEATHINDCLRYAAATHPLVKDKPKEAERIVKPKIPTAAEIGKRIMQENRLNGR